MKKLIAIALMIAFALPLLAGCETTATLINPQGDAAPYQRISGEEALQMMQEEEDYVILDVRRPEEFAKGHIPDAVNIPLDAIEAERFSGLSDKDQLIMVYCRSGNRSNTASAKLAHLGYTNVVEFGGIISWPGDVVSD